MIKDVGFPLMSCSKLNETKRRLFCTSEEWPIANLYMPGYDQDQLMSSHKSNHITICYGNILQELASTAEKIGIEGSVVGDARKEFVAR